MEIHLIVAVSKSNLGIGKNNELLWHLPADMQFFKQTTIGFPVITGRKNYESIPEKFRPLADRKNIILTHQKNYAAPGAIVVNNIIDAIGIVKGEYFFNDDNAIDYNHFRKVEWISTNMAASPEKFLKKKT